MNSRKEKAAFGSDPDKLTCLLELRQVITSSQITILQKCVSDENKREPIVSDLKSINEAVRSGPKAEEERLWKLLQQAGNNKNTLATIVAREKAVKDAEMALVKEKMYLEHRKSELERQEDNFVDIQASTDEHGASQDYGEVLRSHGQGYRQDRGSHQHKSRQDLEPATDRE